MNKNLTPRVEEEIITTSDLKEMKGKYLAENLYRKWTEDFIDEDTGETVAMERREIIAERGKYIDNELLTEIDFFLQSGDISEVKISNVQRVGFENQRYTTIWAVTAEIKAKKKHFYLGANSIEMAHDIATDYIEQSYKGSFSVVAIKELSYVNIVPFVKENAPDNELKWHQIQLKIDFNEEHPAFENEFIVKATDAEEAKALSEVFFNEHLNGGKYEFTSRLLSAKNINIEAVISHEFCMKYLKSE